MAHFTDHWSEFLLVKTEETLHKDYGAHSLTCKSTHIRYEVEGRFRIDAPKSIEIGRAVLMIMTRVMLYIFHDPCHDHQNSTTNLNTFWCINSNKICMVLFYA